ncbi:MAG: hypothetical protein LBS43_06290, partial [Prevotellaceae bacterium]|nr:hypothetical protein [Prevotellaceae bacterium]
NENLTVPQFSIPKNTAFAGKYPYNGALIQVPTMVNEEFTIVQLAADPAVDDIWIEEVDALNSKLCVRIKNLGVKNTNPTLPVAFYKGGIALSTPAGGANQSKPVGVVIQPGDTYTVCSDNILVAELQPQMSVRIQDDGVKFLADGSYLDCDSTNNIGTVNSLLAIRDYVISVADKPVDFNVLDNDYFGSCDRSTLSAFDTIANSGLKHGSLIINNSDGDYTYTPAAGFMGIDSLTYYIKCGVDSSAAKVYILIHKPLSQQYVACHEASITMGFTPVSGISYYWYASETGGTPIATGNPSNTLTVTKNNSAIETWWVEARHGNIAFSRYRINLLLGDCGITDPTGCAIDGTVIFKEDFGGNDNTTSNVSPTGIGSRSEYAYTSNLSDHNGGDDIYTISKYVTSVNPAWHDIFDHTSLLDKELGYCMFVNGKTKKKAYELEINDLCPNTLLYFSIWVTNIVKSGQGLDKPYLELVLYDKSTGDTISIYRTGATMNEETSLTWKMYGFPFTTPSDMTDLVFIIYSDGDGSGGNDYAIDDIEVRFCAPKVNTNIIANDTLICAGTDLDIIGTYIEDCTFGDEVAYRWEFRHIDSVAWKPLQEDNEEVMLDCNATDPEERTIESTWSIYSANENNVGYYRMLVSSPINIDNAVCRAASDSILVRMIPTTKAADIRVDVCPLPVRQIHLTKFIDTLKYTTVDWEKVSSAGPDVLDPHAGTINTQGVNSTYKYKYLLMSECGTSAAVAYVHSLKDRLQRKIAPIFICKEQETSAYVNINRILGLELGIEVSGVTWTYPVNPDNVVTKNLISIPTSSPYSGAIVFNARAAWEDAVISGNTAYDAGYAADPNAKKFVFRYTVSGSCIGAVTKDIIIIVTEKMF